MKRRGRPPLDPTQAPVSVNLRLPAKTYDAAWTQARAERMTMPDWIRATLVKATSTISRNTK